MTVTENEAKITVEGTVLGQKYKCKGLPLVSSNDHHFNDDHEHSC